MSIELQINKIYQAPWPKSLDPTQIPLSEKVGKIALMVFAAITVVVGLVWLIGYGLFRLAAMAVLPAKMRDPIDDPDIDPYRCSFKTPDSVLIDAIFFEGNSNKDKVIIFAGGNGVLYHDHLDFLEQLRQKTGASVMSFDPRGVGRSESFPTPEGLALDTYATYKYLIDEKGFLPQDILLCGHSMGGARGVLGAALIQEEYPYVPISALSIHSFSNLTTAAKYAISNKCLANFAACLLKTVGWEMSVKPAWDKLKGEKCVVYNPGDAVVQKPASLYERVIGDGPLDERTTVMKVGDYEDGQELSLLAHQLDFSDEEEQALLQQIGKMLKIPLPFEGENLNVS